MNSRIKGTTEASAPALTQGALVVERVKDMLTRGELSAGDRLPVEKDLAEQLGVSRGSLREGVRALCILGILETRQGDGTYVTSLQAESLLAPVEFLVELQSRDSVFHLQTVRRVLEAEAAAKAAQRISDEALAECEAVLASLEPDINDAATSVTNERLLAADLQFHRIIAEASDNPTLAALIGVLSDRTVRGRYWRALTVHGVNMQTHLEHRAILSALQAHEPDHARTFMTNHLLRVENFLESHSVPAQ